MTMTIKLSLLALTLSYSFAARAGGFIRLHCDSGDATLSISDLRPKPPSLFRQLSLVHPRLGTERLELAPGEMRAPFVVTQLTSREVELLAFRAGGARVSLIGRAPDGSSRLFALFHRIRLHDRSDDPAASPRTVDVTMDIYGVVGPNERLEFHDCHLVSAAAPTSWLAMWRGE